MTGLYNFRARWYDSTIGRWLSKDPIGLEGGLNLYVFCGNDPVNFVDPFGLCEDLPWGVQQDMVGIQDMSGVYIAELAAGVLKWGRLLGWAGNKIDDLYRGLSRYGDDVARGANRITKEIVTAQVVPE